MKNESTEISYNLVLVLLVFLVAFTGCEKKYITIIQPDEHTPRVIWVPDDYETIQGAINASEDGDTVRVRAGTYCEGIHSNGRNIWLESAEGPELTQIDGTGWNDVIRIDYGSTKMVIRGFKIIADFNGIQILYNSRVSVFNCILLGSDRDDTNGILISLGSGNIYNCVLDNLDWGIYTGYAEGCVYNCIIINCNSGYYKSATYKDWIDHDWNLFWFNELNYEYEASGPNDVFEDPLLISGYYRPSVNSPAINAGNPEINDRDGSRSDIGAFGGPYSYTNP